MNSILNIHILSTSDNISLPPYLGLLNNLLVCETLQHDSLESFLHQSTRAVDLILYDAKTNACNLETISTLRNSFPLTPLIVISNSAREKQGENTFFSIPASKNVLIDLAQCIKNIEALSKHLKKTSILIIDDCEDDFDTYTHIIKKLLHCKTTNSFDNQSTIDLIERENFDLFLLDYQLPGISGLEIIKQLDKNYLSGPILALTGSGDEKIAVKFMQHGADSYLVKDDISPSSLSFAICDVFEKYQERSFLKEKKQELEFFAETVAHDLKAPLGRVSSYARLLKTSLPENIPKFAQHITNDCQFMVSFLDQLWQYSLAGRNSQKKVKLDLRTILERAVNNLEVAIDEKKAVVDLKGITPIEIYGEKTALTQLFQNLVGNALKYSTVRPIVKIKGYKHGDLYIVEVKDNGVGIAKDKTKEIFKPFSRIAATSETTVGLGLGLALCEKIVSQHNGFISVDSKPKKGSTFKIGFPI